MRTEKRFLKKAPKLSTESTESWMTGISKRNSYAGANTLMRHLRKVFKNQNLTLNQINRGTHLGVLEYLSDLAQIPLEDLMAGTFLRYADMLSPSFMINAGGQSTNANELAYNLFRTQVHACSSCVSITPHISILWYLDILFLCPEHLELLTNICPRCGKALTAEEMILNQCAACESTFTIATKVQVGSSSLISQSQRFIANLFDNLHAYDKILPTDNRAVVLWFLLGIQDAVNHAGNNWDYSYKAGSELPVSLVHLRPNLNRAEALATAFKSLLDWPHGFYEFLAAYRERPDKPNGYGITREFGILYTTWLSRRWDTQEFQFVHDAFNNYLSQNFEPYERLPRSDWAKAYPEIHENSDFISLKNATKEYNLSFFEILQAIEDKRLHKYDALDGVMEYLKRSELDRFMNGEQSNTE